MAPRRGRSRRRCAQDISGGIIKAPGRGTEFPRSPSGRASLWTWSTLSGHAAKVTRDHEYATRGIRVNVVSPGVVNPPIHMGEGPKALGARHPVGHMGEVSGIGDPSCTSSLCRS